jgi:hypothetical protein
LTAYLAKLLTEPNGSRPAEPYKRTDRPDYTSDQTDQKPVDEKGEGSS